MSEPSPASSIVPSARLLSGGATQRRPSAPVCQSAWVRLICQRLSAPGSPTQQRWTKMISDAKQAGRSGASGHPADTQPMRRDAHVPAFLPFAFSHCFRHGLVDREAVLIIHSDGIVCALRTLPVCVSSGPWRRRRRRGFTRWISEPLHAPAAVGGHVVPRWTYSGEKRGAPLSVWLRTGTPRPRS